MALFALGRAYLALGEFPEAELEFETCICRGGEALGLPAHASKAAGTTLALIDPSGIALGEAEVSLRTSREASVQMLDTPTNDTVTPTATSLVSLWQTNSFGLLTEKTINWEASRPSVSVITGVASS